MTETNYRQWWIGITKDGFAKWLEPKAPWIDACPFAFFDSDGNHECKDFFAVIEKAAYDSALIEIERLTAMLKYEREREFPTQSQREMELAIEIESLKNKLKLAEELLKERVNFNLAIEILTKALETYASPVTKRYQEELGNTAYQALRKAEEVMRAN